MSFIIATLLAGVSLYLSFIFQTLTFFRLGCVILIYTVATLVLLTVMKMMFKCRIEAPVGLTHEDGKAVILVHIRSGFGLQRLKLLIEYGRGNDAGIQGKSCKKWLTLRNIKRGENSLSYEIVLPEAGDFCFVAEKARIYDMLGLFSMKKRLRSHADILKLPDIEAAPVVIGKRVIDFSGDSDNYDELRPGYDPSEVFEIRQYRPGDKLQKIHWKLSARMDELMIKESSLPRACPVVLFLGISEMNDYEKIIGWMAAVSFTLMDRGCLFFATWYSRKTNDVIRICVSDEESFFFMLICFMRDSTAISLEEIRKLYDRKYTGDRFLYGLWFERDRLLVNDETIKYGEELQLI